MHPIYAVATVRSAITRDFPPISWRRHLTAARPRVASFSVRS